MLIKLIYSVQREAIYKAGAFVCINLMLLHEIDRLLSYTVDISYSFNACQESEIIASQI